MRLLVWKDFRMNGLIVITGLVLLAIPHAVALYAALFGLGSPVPEGMSRLTMHLFPSSIFGLVLSTICFAFLGGNAIAGERADRSAEFLAYLPVTRRRILVSKLLAAAAIMALIWLPNLLIGILTLPEAVLPLARDTKELLEIFANAAITGLVFFCVAWLFSAGLESPAIAAAAGLIAPFLLLGGIYWVYYLLDFPPGFNPAPWYYGLCFALALFSFAAGTWWYLRNVEP
jgi:ABC-type transport system involved in multi-copper enzyme maturation permease subunit